MQCIIFAKRKALTNLIVERPLSELAAKPLSSRVERRPVVAQLFVVAERTNLDEH